MTEELHLDPAINDMVVRITTAAIMCLDADEENTARLAAFERGIVQDIHRFRETTLATTRAELAAMRSERDSAHNANQVMAEALAAKDATIIQLGENAAKAAGEYAEEVGRLQEDAAEKDATIRNLLNAVNAYKDALAQWEGDHGPR